MKKLKLLLIATLVAVVAGCSTTLYNVNNHPVPNSITSPQMKKAILTAGGQIGWKMTEVKPGLIKATYAQGKHLAVVNIKYSTQSFSITRANSAGFEYDAKNSTIRRHYNWWISNLEKKIIAQVNLAAH
ncbi:hypothetical protein [Piscirickettsia litoralis]|uniref:Lipoprotein n=1 Tax=Piscirickettsia litoralis TaxID=1891921 RepID=A0ABX3A5P1_9GAMM|nr:hypothetical protein [Piscirickettsia litoralis]ODN42760.1 hypothetical protein BGC07_07265 [Piscirickettsia litoralis]